MHRILLRAHGSNAQQFPLEISNFLVNRLSRKSSAVVSVWGHTGFDLIAGLANDRDVVGIYSSDAEVS